MTDLERAREAVCEYFGPNYLRATEALINALIDSRASLPTGDAPAPETGEDAHAPWIFSAHQAKDAGKTAILVNADYVIETADALHSSQAEVERLRGELNANEGVIAHASAFQETAMANLDRAEKAEAALADLRGRVEKAVSLCEPENSGFDHGDDLNTIEQIRALLTEGKTKATDQPREE